ncbi:hypothetical protein AUM59_15150 [Cronobacter sakazakii]|jgi:hypothetical protein|nr:MULTISPECIES: hypothetical protein [Enterobacteriaceae]MDK1221957.1 hypothetical protein [Cronobacter turicensis]GJL05612.1 hypothetical protein TUM17570_46210 [Enterobacter cloacae]EGT4387192.1 hypothetical protein [Cronobacter sakazakii]EGT4392327.1 hypothetical protein [Cronobacter sakazakii]EGT4395625.1 hypothetical protein [Cronobacter sakazakii]
MLKITSALFLSAMLFSTASDAMGREEHWGSWFGTINVMEFELNTDNSAGERLTLTCRDNQLVVGYSAPDKAHAETPDDGQKTVGLNINSVHYQTSEAAFMALKNSDSDGQIEVTSMNKALSHPFKTAGLHDALQDLTWEDCISH